MRFTPRKYTRIVPILRIIRPCVAKDCTGKIERTLGAGVEVSGRVRARSPHLPRLLRRQDAQRAATGFNRSFTLASFERHDWRGDLALGYDTLRYR
jgi:hypothetical protein